jgi:hypothetical protein
MIYGFKGGDHLEAVLFRNDRTGFVFDVRVPSNDYPELVTHFF